MMRTCEVCGGLAPASERCTNGRCGACHSKHCTGGGITEPGHGRGTVAIPFSREAIQREVDQEWIEGKMEPQS